MNLRFNTQCQQAGFSLLEVLVAFSILALSLGVLFQIYSRGSSVTALSRDYSKALIVAQSQLAALDLEDQIELGDKSGKSKNGIQWQRHVSPYVNVSETETSFRRNYQLVNVEIEVNWKTLGRKHGFKLKSLRLTGMK